MSTEFMHNYMDILPSDAVGIIADQASLRLFYVIARKREVGSADLMRMSKLSLKGYYTRTRNMRNVGLIRRTQGVFTLTAFGQVLYHACLQIDEAIHRNLDSNNTYQSHKNASIRR